MRIRHYARMRDTGGDTVGQGDLEQYIDACELIKDTKEEIGKLRKRRRQIQKDSVKGSAQEFPYTLQTYHLEGLGYATVKDPDELDRMEELLAERIRNAERIKRQVETWLNTVSPRMQRIIRYRVFDDMTWAQVAVKMGRKATEASVKMEFQRFMSAA